MIGCNPFHCAGIIQISVSEWSCQYIHCLQLEWLFTNLAISHLPTRCPHLWLLQFSFSGSDLFSSNCEQQGSFSFDFFSFITTIPS